MSKSTTLFLEVIRSLFFHKALLVVVSEARTRVPLPSLHDLFHEIMFLTCLHRRIHPDLFASHPFELNRNSESLKVNFLNFTSLGCIIYGVLFSIGIIACAQKCLGHAVSMILQNEPASATGVTVASLLCFADSQRVCRPLI